MLLAWVFLSVSSRCNIDGFFGWLEGKSLEALKKLRRLKRCCCFFTLLLRSLGSTKLYTTSLRRLPWHATLSAKLNIFTTYNKEVVFVSRKQTTAREALFMGFSTWILKIEKRQKSTEIRNYPMCTLCLCICKERRNVWNRNGKWDDFHSVSKEFTVFKKSFKKSRFKTLCERSELCMFTF